MAPDQKGAHELNASLVFTDETGFLLAPLARGTQAPRGRTPILHQRAEQRRKVSVAAALTLSPVRGHLGLYSQTYPDWWVDSELYALFLRHLLYHLRGNVVLLQDGGRMHQGPPIRAVQQEHPRLHLYTFPPYAPELNPVEYLWTYTKSHRLANFVPLDIGQIDATVCTELQNIRHDQTRIRSFFRSAPLAWNNTTLLF